VGFRLPPLLASDRAWLRGHQATIRPLSISAAVGIAALIASVVLSRYAWPYLITLGIALCSLIIGVIVATVRAVQEAKRAG
jgi:hypothetical protein